MNQNSHNVPSHPPPLPHEIREVYRDWRDLVIVPLVLTVKAPIEAPVVTVMSAALVLIVKESIEALAAIDQVDQGSPGA